MLTHTIVTVGVILGALFNAPAQTIDCARQPYGVTGCEAYLGALVRQREGLNLPNTSDEKLGRAVRMMCFGRHHERELRLGPGDRELADNIRLVQRRTVPKYCG